MGEWFHKAKGLGVILTALEERRYFVVGVEQHDDVPSNFTLRFHDGRKIVLHHDPVRIRRLALDAVLHGHSARGGRDDRRGHLDRGTLDLN